MKIAVLKCSKLNQKDNKKIQLKSLNEIFGKKDTGKQLMKIYIRYIIKTIHL